MVKYRGWFFFLKKKKAEKFWGIRRGKVWLGGGGCGDRGRMGGMGGNEGMVDSAVVLSVGGMIERWARRSR